MALKYFCVMKTYATLTHRLYFFFFLILANCATFAQQDDKPFIKLMQPGQEKQNVSSSRNYIVGSTCKSCNLLLNGEKVKVYPTGAFATELRLQPGDTAFTLVAISGEGKSTSKRLFYSYQPLPAPQPVQSFGIESIQTIPAGDQVLIPGDEIRFRVKAFPGQRLRVNGSAELFQMPVTDAQSMQGIYQGIYRITEKDSFTNVKLPVDIIDSSGKQLRKETPNRFTTMQPAATTVLLTKGRLAHLEYGLGEDRLGGAKIGYIDSLIPLEMTGKIGEHYRVRLAPGRTAYIPEDVVTVAPKGSFPPASLTGKWRVFGDSAYDYVNIELFSRLPYQSFQLTDPSRIVVDIFGATNNSNWITNLSTAKEISGVNYEQVADGIFRVTLQLTHKQHWGHQVYFQGNTLVIRVKRPPSELSLNRLTIAVDAGHGGTNKGAVGPTGVLEKELTLALALKLRSALQAAGANVIMTRDKETFFDNKERILFYRDSQPDLLISLHLNSSGDPINVGGTATFYRYPGFKSLNTNIYKQLQKLGLREYGNNSSFNFMLNSPTEYPNCLVELLFLSNPAEEMKILDDGFQKETVNAIVQGIRDFLKDAK